jgi:hypothetical protein
MVSTDHFRQELSAQLAGAVQNGRLDLLISASELCRSIQNGGASQAYCCDAMEAEMRIGDTLLLERDNGVEMIVRYLLPRRTN